jgi:glycerol-3-phosphate dehydrogenase (NAD(P)+)
VKNIIAIASGMIDGLGYPISTQALLITQSLHDIKALIHALGGSKKTILSFAGFGDILLTCTSEKSRNYSFGRLIGSGAPKEEIEEYKNKITIEGLYTLKSIHKLIRKKKIKIPTIDIIYNIVFKDTKIDKLIEYLMI